MKKRKINWEPMAVGVMSTVFTIIFMKLGFNEIITFFLVAILILIFSIIYNHYE